MEYQAINTPQQLQNYCESLKSHAIIGFDTEFVSEDRFRPELCLIQVAAGDELAVIDPISVGDTTPFWEELCSGGHTVIAHAAREEIRFAFRHTRTAIGGLFDTQLAAAFVGIEYPASLATLVDRLLGERLPKGETRTNWRHRPLTPEQITYALRDVTGLLEMRSRLQKSIDELDRDAWVVEEVERLQQKVITAETSCNWRRVSGSSGLKPRQQEIVRQLWIWREDVAEQFDRLPRRVLRDDLMVELAKRSSPEIHKIKGIRGMERRGLTQHYEDIAGAIQQGLDVPDSELPKRERRHARVGSPMLSQFLSTSIACISRQHKLSPAIVGNSDDVKDLLAYELQPRRGSAEPELLKGWRGEIVGKTFRRILAGELAIRVADVNEEQPLEFVDS